MATFPAFGIDISSTISQDDGVRPDKADDGTLRMRVIYSQDVCTLKVTTTPLNATDKTTLNAFYLANRTSPNLLAWPDGRNFSVWFASSPQENIVTGNLSSLTFNLIGQQV